MKLNSYDWSVCRRFKMDRDSNDKFEDWNMAKAYYMRLDEILTMCTLSQIKGDGMMWYKSLYRLYVEIESKMSDEQKKKGREMLLNITKIKIDAMKTKKPIQTLEFVEFELYLRQILEDRNMLTPRKNIEGL